MATSGRRGPALAAVVVVLVAALLGGAWFVLRSGTSGSPDPSKPPDRASAPSAGSGLNPSSEPSPLAPPQAATGSVNSTGVASVRRVEELPEVPSDRILIVVRRARDHAPIAGAKVWWASQGVLQRKREWHGGDESYVDENELVEEVGERGETDARGFLFIPWDRPRYQADLVISARYETLWALVTAVPRGRSMPAVVTLDLAADDAIRVQIVDDRGTPQPGLVAAFGTRGGIGSGQSRRARTEERDAIATIRGVAAFARLFSDSERMEWTVGAVVPLRDPVLVPIDPARLPKEPVVVKLPPCGRMLFTFVDADGAAMVRRARVVMNAMPPLGPPDATGRLVRPVLLHQQLVGRNGGLEVPLVGCGLEFELRVEVDGVGVFGDVVKGPDSPGETVERTLKLEFGRLAFTGTILHQDDLPLPKERVTVRVLANRGGDVLPFEEPCVGEGETDEKGDFSIEVPVAGRSGSFDCELLVHSAVGLEHTLNAVAVAGAKGSPARLGTLRLPGK
jgi:hypothetical protein